MQINVIWNSQVSGQFPNLAIGIGLINGVCIEENNQQLCHLKKIVYEEVDGQFEIDRLKEDMTVRAYRDFYWKLGIDPTKTRPSGEALLRRVLHGDELPHVSAVVDAYNLASTKTILPISGFDADLLNPPFHIRFARNGEIFTGIGLNKPISLTDKALILTDEKQIMCIYPYRDADSTKITMQTRNALIIAYGVPRIGEQILKEVAETALDNIKQVSLGEIGMTKVFSASAQ